MTVNKDRRVATQNISIVVTELNIVALSIKVPDYLSVRPINLNENILIEIATDY